MPQEGAADHRLEANATAGALGLGVSGVVTLRSLREQAFTAALTAASESGPAAFGLHARTESVLTFAGSL
jgi:hypothetical protein